MILHRFCRRRMKTLVSNATPFIQVFVAVASAPPSAQDNCTSKTGSGASIMPIVSVHAVESVQQATAVRIFSILSSKTYVC